jgi:serralysin
MSLPSWTNAQILGQLSTGFYWGNSTITYAFPTSSIGMTSDDGEATRFSTLSTQQRTAATVAIGLWDDLIAPDFINSNSSASDIEFGNSTAATTFAHAYFPANGTVWLNSNNADLKTPIIGKYGFFTFIHELGHALGLDHMGNYNGDRTGGPSSYEDSTVLSVMSYFGPNWAGFNDFGIGQVRWADWIGSNGQTYDPQTPMLNDIMAIQAIYGVETSTRTGDSIYGFHSNLGSFSGGIYDFTKNANPIICLFDSSGNDTLDLSGWSTGSTINLNAGAFSSCNSLTDNISIAYTAIIENATGGSGNDTIYGNGYDNRLIGGAGADSLFGGDGYDTANYYGSLTGVNINLNLAGSQSSGGDGGGDLLSGFEGIDGSNAGGDVLTGDAGGNWLLGYGGNDYIVGGAGADGLVGGDGFDTVSYYSSSLGVNIYLGTTGSQSSGGDGAGDLLFSFEGIHGSNIAGDVLTGDGNGNWILGYGGNDYITGGAGADGLAGGDGFDTVSYYWSSSVNIYLGTTGAQSSTGDGAGDLLSGFEGIDGSNSGNDVLTGDANGNWILGYGGNDYVTGGAGADGLVGGDGFDTVSYYWSSASVNINLNVSGAQLSGGDGASDMLSGFEGIDGSNVFGDVLTGDAGGNWIIGYGGNDYVTGGGGADGLVGGDGFDTVSYFSSSAGVNINLGLVGSQSSGGDGAGDLLSGFEGLDGSDVGSDVLTGDAGGNWILGRGGNDIITGGAGSDGLVGGIGNDTFNFSAGFGRDTITDFSAGLGVTDVISFSLGAAFDTFEEVMAAVTQVGSNSLFTLDGNNTITFSNLLASALVADDFVFV